MIPLHDDNPTIVKPVVTVIFIIGCVAAFLWQIGLDRNASQLALVQLGFVPGFLFGEGREVAQYLLLPPAATIVTSMFLHGGWWHLIGNMLYLWIFGNNVEDSMGHGRFVLFYLLSGAAAAAVQAASDPGSLIPMIGASGAVSGILGAYLLLYPRARILVLIPIGIPVPVRLPAMIVLGFWFVMQFANAAASDPGQGGVAFWAHVGGFVAGMGMIFIFRRPHVPKPSFRRVILPGPRKDAPSRQRGPWE